MDPAYYMKQALDLARCAWGKTSPNPMVGAVIVKDNQIVGCGYHRQAGGPHAEVFALEEAGEAARGADLYVTLEPCSHYGRTPPCAEAIIKAGIRRVIAAMEDPNPLVAGRGFAVLRQAGIEVEVGVLEDEARKLNEVFIKYITTRRPFVILKSAITLDGKIATAGGDSRWVTGEAAREMVHSLRDFCDGIMAGIGTVLADNPRLTARLPGGGRDPLRIILDSNLRIPLDAQVVTQESRAKTLIATTMAADLQKKRSLEDLGVEVVTLPSDQGRVSLTKLMEVLGQKGITSILLEGGAELNASALASRIVDKVMFFIAPKLLGGSQSPGPIGGAGVSRMADALAVENLTVQPVGEDFLLSGYPNYRSREER